MKPNKPEITIGTFTERMSADSNTYYVGFVAGQRVVLLPTGKLTPDGQPEWKLVVDQDRQRAVKEAVTEAASAASISVGNAQTNVSLTDAPKPRSQTLRPLAKLADGECPFWDDGYPCSCKT